MTALRVAITIGPAVPSGIGVYSFDLALALDRRDDVDVIPVGTPHALAQLDDRSATSFAARLPLPGQRSLEQFATLLLRRRLDRLGIDVFHGTRQVVPGMWRGPSVLTVHDDYPLSRRAEYDRAKRLLLPPVFRRSVRSSDALMVLAPHVMPIARRLAQGDTPVIDAGGGVSTALAAAVPEPPAACDTQRPFVLVVGDAGPRKRMGEIVEAWPSVASAKDVDLVIAGGRRAGDGLRASVETSHAMHLLTEVPDAGLSWLYRNALMVLDAAADEGFGMVRAEAAHLGAAYRELRGAIDPSGLQDLVAGVLGDRDSGPPKASDLTAALEQWDDVADRTIDVYRRVLQSHEAR
ncbi:MAG: glycosyltransferase [Actinomycetota bacterium]